MNMRRFLGAASGLSFALLFGCAGDVKTIDRTQPNALPKSQFEGLWYHRAAVVGADPESGQPEGITSGTDKVRWEITENLLIGYRSYEFVPYAEGLTDQGRDFFGSPVVAFPILKHFDIQRDYNPTTGVQNNVIVENDSDRPWFERKYVRVDWSQNVVGGDTRFPIGWQNYPTGYFSGKALASYYVQGHEETNPDRPIFTKDYFDVTNNYSVAPDAYYCEMMLLYNAVPRCGAGRVKVRLSFRKVDPSDDYESLYYPDYLELKDDQGNALLLTGGGRQCDQYRDPGDCQVQTYPYDAQFGNFRTLRVAFDKERFLTRTGRVYVAGRFDIWKNSFNADGSRIPYEQRKPVPLVYYGNVNFPEDMIPNAQKIASYWNKPLLQTVAFLKNKMSDGKPDVAQMRRELGFDMFQFRQNDCNPKNVQDYARNNNLVGVVERVIGGSIDRVARGNVEQACAALQYADLKNGKTLDPKDGRAMAFTWQRTGDLRYSFQDYHDSYLTYTWGVAQFAQDPETGEFISNTANYLGTTGDIVAQSETDLIQWLNGDMTQEELMRGDFTRNEVVSRRAAKDNNVRTQVRDLLMGHEQKLLEAGHQIATDGTPGGEDARFARLFRGTDVERDLLVSDEILRAFAGPRLYQPSGSPAGDVGSSVAGNLVRLVPGEVTDDAMKQASPVAWGLSQETNPFEKFVTDFGTRAWEMADFFEPNTSGLADAFKGQQRDKITQFFRTSLFEAVNAHEVGHTLGLRHNFEGSIDALNYASEFWYKENNDGTVTQYWNNPPKPGNAHRGNEYKYSSIMDYGFDVPLEGLHGIGAYDEAAVRFFYGQIVDTWDSSKVSIPDARKYGSWARRCGYQSAAIGLENLLYWLGPGSIPSVFSSEPALGNDGQPCTYIDPSTGRENFDADASKVCDSRIDKVFRELVRRVDASARQNNNKSECWLFYNVNELNNLIHDVHDLYGFSDETDQNVRTEKQLKALRNISEARKMVPVSKMIAQQIQVVSHPPKLIDDPNAPFTDEGSDKGFPWSTYIYPVHYKYCSDLYARYSNPACQRWDTGWNFRESTDAHIMAYDRDYVFDHFRRDRFSTVGWGSPSAYMARLTSRRLYHMTNVFRYYLYTRRSAFEAPLYKDWAEAAYKGLNFLERIIQTPEPGRYCLNRAVNPPAGKYELDPTGSRPSCLEEMTVGLGYGEGKYINTAWTNEYFYKANRIGAFYDKLAAIRQLTSSSGFFVRDFADLFDRRAYSLGYIRAYEDPIIQRFSALIQGDHEGYKSVVATDPAGKKYVRYMPFFDETEAIGRCTTNRDCSQFPGTSCDTFQNTCVGGSVRNSLSTLPTIEPAWSWSLQFYALAYAISNFSSIYDSAPEFYRFTKVAIKGTPEDITYGPDMRIVEFTDPESRITYRAPDIKGQPAPSLVSPFPAYYGDGFSRRRNQGYRDWGIGADLLKKANAYVRDVWDPRKAACPDATASNAACDSFRAARRELNAMTGYIDIVRRFNRQAEIP